MIDFEKIEQELMAFKANMLIAHPFYGDILLRIPLVRDESAGTACTDGRTIRWSGGFFQQLDPRQRRYVLMHEVFHVLLMHPARLKGRDPDVWNAAADIIVNNICDRLMYPLRSQPELAIGRPPVGIFRNIDINETAENLYGRILADNEKHKSGTLCIRRSYRRSGVLRNGEIGTDQIVLGRHDLTGSANGLSPDEEQALEQLIAELLREAAAQARGSGDSIFIPRELSIRLHMKSPDWRRLLKDFLSEAQSDETSYLTPERKYLHMGMILPGHGLREEGELEQVWAFVDSSGSISKAELESFLTQLHKIARDFHCTMNIAYWDTDVTDVFENLRDEKQVLTAQPSHSGGTDINCVYRYIRERHLRPLVTMILTDGYFGVPDPSLKNVLKRKNTILLICNGSENPVYNTIGRVCRLII